MRNTFFVKTFHLLFPLLLTTFLLVSTISCTSASPHSSNTPTPTPSTTPRALQVGDLAPDFSLDTLDGTSVLHLSDFPGKTILLSFWNIDCSSCIEQLRVIQKFYAYQQSIGKPFAVLSVNIDGVSKFVTVAALQQRLALTFPILVDNHYRARNLYPFTSVPMSYIIDGHRYIRTIFTGPFDETMLRTTLSRFISSSS